MLSWKQEYLCPMVRTMRKTEKGDEFKLLQYLLSDVKVSLPASLLSMTREGDGGGGEEREARGWKRIWEHGREERGERGIGDRSRGASE